MSTNALLVATAMQSYGGARMARCLAEAGFAVSLLTPPGAAAAKSRYVSRVGHLAADATPMQWVYAFAAMVKASSPRVVLPCDDTAVRLLHALALTPPEQLPPAARLELAALVAESLGS